MKSGPRKTATLAFVTPKSPQYIYAIAAGTAGISVMALVSPSEAEILYTPANKTITRDRSYNLDLNHDGSVDFVLVDHCSILGSNVSHSFQILEVIAEPNNGVNCIESFCMAANRYAAALRRGDEIGSAITSARMVIRICSNGRHSGRERCAARILRPGTIPASVILGCAFQINGETHFGWARLNVVFHNGAPQDQEPG